MRNMKVLLSSAKRIGYKYFHSTDEEKSRINTITAAAFGSVSVLFKLVIGIFTSSFVWISSCVYGIGGVVAKGISYRGIKEKEERGKAAARAFTISIVLLFSGLIFDICMMLKQVMPSTQTRYPVAVVIVASIYFTASYGLAIKGLFQIRKRKEILFFALKIIGMSGALMNMVLLQRMVMSCTSLPYDKILSVNSIFGYFIGGTLVLMAVILMVKSVRAKRYS